MRRRYRCHRSPTGIRIPDDDDALMRIVNRYGCRNGPRRDVAFWSVLRAAVRRELVERR